jgi:ADP-heptose:LPS heptosyltransferase
MRGRYLIRNPVSNAAIALVDGTLAAFVRRAEGAGRPRVRRILLANTAHLGDVVIASSLLPVVRARFPEARVGLLVGSWSRALLEGHPEVEWIHTMDHWRLNRSGERPLAKLKRHARTRRAALAEIREIGYDAAIDLSPYFPNAVPLLWRAGIPVRVGYTSGGFGPLLSHPTEWRDESRHVAESQLALLDRISRPSRGERAPTPSLPPLDPFGLAETTRRLESASIEPGSFVVLHMGTGLKIKEWPAEKWRSLAEALSQEGLPLVFTGAGEAETLAAEQVARGLSPVLNLCGRVGWKGYLAALASAKLVICIDSVAAHAAAAVRTPCVTITTGMNNIHYWRPQSERALVVTRDVPCAPCHRSRGCAHMECVRGIGVDEVMGAAHRLLGREARISYAEL